MPNAIHGYSSICALTHRQCETLLEGLVLIQEKIDGSQMSAYKDPESGLMYFNGEII